MNGAEVDRLVNHGAEFLNGGHRVVHVVAGHLVNHGITFLSGQIFPESSITAVTAPHSVCLVTTASAPETGRNAQPLRTISQDQD